MAFTQIQNAPTVPFLSASSLSLILQQKSPSLYSCLLDMQERALNGWLSLLIPEQGSHSGLLHIYNVARNVDKMIPASRREELTAGEIFLLLAAVLLHDIGRTEPGAAQHRNLDFCEKEKMCTERRCQLEHWDHHIKSRDIILTHGFELGLPHEMAIEYCSLLAYCHRLNKPPRVKQPRFIEPTCRKYFPFESGFHNTSVEPFGQLRIPMLAALLRIADETENHWNRACQDRWRKVLKIPRDEPRKAFRRLVEDVEFSHAGGCVIMHIASEPEEEEDKKKSFARMTGEIEGVLNEWVKELKPLGIEFRRVFFRIGGNLARVFKDEAGIQDKRKSSAFKNDVGDKRKVESILNSLIALYQGTMKHTKFSLASLEAEIGRPLDERDRWILELMEEWVPDTLHFDHHRNVIDILGENPVKSLKSLLTKRGRYQ